MSQLNPFGRSFAARRGTIRAWATGRTAGAAMLLALGFSGLQVSDAAATYAVALSIGGLLLIGAAAVARSQREPRRVLVQCRRARRHPCRDR